MQRALQRLVPTKQQIEILQHVEEYVRKHDFYPNMRDLAYIMDRNVSTISRQLMELERKGYIERSPHRKYRQIKVIRDYEDAIYYRSEKYRADLEQERLQARINNLEERKAKHRKASNANPSQG